MAPSDEKIKEKFQALLSEGQRLSEAGCSLLDFQRLFVQAVNLVDRVCGPKSFHTEAIRKSGKLPDLPGSHLIRSELKKCLGILRGAYQDYEDGFLAEIRNLVRAELFDDFLSQAEALLEQGYHIPAASLAGAVLEDTLRKLCDKHSIPYGPKTKIDSLNADLAKGEVYDKLIQKEITAKADLRNNADHGYFEKVRADDVKDMVRWVRRFVSERLQ